MVERLSNMSNSWDAKDLDAVLHPNTNFTTHVQRGPLVLVRGEGVRVWDSDGREYIEGMAGLWCTAIGYGNEELAEVAAEQMRTLSFTHMFGGKSHIPGVELASMLKEMLPMDTGKIFFGNSGSDANDTQVKLVRYYNNAIGRPKKKKIISRNKAYHGSTVASGSLTGLPPFHIDFDLPIDGILHTDCPHYYRFSEPDETEEEFATRLAHNLAALIEKEGADTIAACIVEPVMCGGGMMPPPATYFDKVVPLLKENDILLIDDEVVCGFGRTGKPFGCDTYGFRPDTMTIAKALSSAYLPISAVAIPDWMYEPFLDQSRKIGMFGHGFTYSGHPVCAAVAVRNLQIMERMDLFNQVAVKTPLFQRLLQTLADHPLAGEVTGVGLLGAVELVRNKTTKEPFAAADSMGMKCADACADAGLIVRNVGDRIIVCPPLAINEADIEELVERFRAGLDGALAACDIPLTC